MSGPFGALAPAIRIARDVATGLRRELTEMQLTGERGQRCALTALAVALATTLALAVHVEDVWWAAISAFMCSQATAPASVQKGILRILGTTAGAGLAVALSPWLAGDDVALSLALFVASTAGMLGMLVSGYGYAWLLGGVTADMVLMALLSDPTSALAVGVDRTVEVAIGTVAAMLVSVLVGPGGHGPTAPPASGWSNLSGAQWPFLRHALRAGLAVMLVPLVWRWLDLPSLSQTAITVAAVMAVPGPPANDAAMNQQEIIERAIHRILGCLFGGVAGLFCLALSIESFLPWMLVLTAGIWIAAHVQATDRGIGYVGTQAAVVFISTLVQGPGPPTSILPGIERFAGITGGLLILLATLALTAPDAKPGGVRPPAVRLGSALCRDE
jgi:uncharacterized membrane protein YccC